jgi:hypothetical protein
MNSKILFLDIDGVLNSELYQNKATDRNNDRSRLDPFSVMLVRKLIEEFTLKIVITSTWRYGAVEKLMQELKRHKLIDYLHNDSFTPVIQPAHRGTEIKLWLELHPEITDYVIIDDDDNILEEQFEKFVKTYLYDGMIEEHYYRVRDILSPVEST